MLLNVVPKNKWAEQQRQQTSVLEPLSDLQDVTGIGFGNWIGHSLAGKNFLS